MKLAYLILAHNNPAHLGRLMEGLKTSATDFFIHIDKKSNLDEFIHLAGTQVFFSNQRVPVYWGTFSQIEATLALMQQAIAAEKPYDYFVLLSGADYPIQSADYIHEFFKNHQGTQFISTLKMPNLAAGKPLSLLEEFNVEGKYKKIKKRAYRLYKALGLPRIRRDYQQGLNGLVPYAGAQWWALTREACEYILKFVETHPKFMQLYQNVLVPDEMFFQTIIGNSHYSSKIARSLTYSDWQAGKSSPENMTENHLAKLKNQSRYLMKCSNYPEGEILFARKFVGDTQALVNLIKKHTHA
ncbi:beta-1,6-N-acetylglucosaminyltransferase [Methylophilus sp. DW102]|uniref:beta-1,6-N-acetylglucosaminyltransferase n=1 Tax=Methylophilus sp. DW102 TaxID=3095607 RepID=UPI003085DB41|nr:glycosyl transferase family 14 [Methylophilus sp. DW102]